ncbi:MAG: hypothetical protein HOW97_07190 [Catenulispora sp.]|nr:hypothetical protein [Catenulispora sp.]
MVVAPPAMTMPRTASSAAVDPLEVWEAVAEEVAANEFVGDASVAGETEMVSVADSAAIDVTVGVGLAVATLGVVGVGVSAGVAAGVVVGVARVGDVEEAADVGEVCVAEGAVVGWERGGVPVNVRLSVHDPLLCCADAPFQSSVAHTRTACCASRIGLKRK